MDRVRDRVRDRVKLRGLAIADPNPYMQLGRYLSGFFQSFPVEMSPEQ